MCESLASSAEPARRRPEPIYDASTVVGHLVHALRQPLSTIESLAYYLKLALGPSESMLSHHLERLRESVLETGWILADAVHLLQIATPCPQTMDLNELVSAQIAELSSGRPRWAEPHLAPEPALVRLDVEQGRHLVRNLLVVLRRLAEPTPLVALETRITSSEVQLEASVWLERPPVENLEELFEPFGADAPAGLGLALASARRIAEAHGGRLQLRHFQNRQLSLLAALPRAA